MDVGLGRYNVNSMGSYSPVLILVLVDVGLGLLRKVKAIADDLPS